MRQLLVYLLIVAGSVPATLLAGHSRFPYFDAGQSIDGRYVVTPRLVGSPSIKKNRPAALDWEFTWEDRQKKRKLTGRLEGLRSGVNAVFEPVHAHIFVAPDGETFAVWNPQVMAPTEPTHQKPLDDRASDTYRRWPGFSHRLVIYRKTGEVVKRLDLADFLRENDWQWLYCYGRQVYWQLEYPGLTRNNAPRVGYALYRISPDYTVLEVTVGANEEAARHARERRIEPPRPRIVRVDLVTGRYLNADAASSDLQKVPVRPFVDEPLRGGRGRMPDYIPSLDPVREPGRFGSQSCDPTEPQTDGQTSEAHK